MSEPVIELLQTLIRNECVNDGSVGSGYEERSVDTLVEFFGVEGHVFEPAPGRQSVVYRVDGTDPTAPTLALLAHLDVVPAEPDGWSTDPFSAVMKDGMVYGRGAVDMLNIAAAMAVAFKPYLTGDLGGIGDLVFCATADEEGGSRFGAAPLVKEQWALVGTDYMLTEVAYPALPGPSHPTVPISIGEKGALFSKLKFSGVPGHGSAPYGTLNAVDSLVSALDGIKQTPSPVSLSPQWLTFVDNLGFDSQVTSKLTDLEQIDDVIDDIAINDPTMARYIHAATHLTISPNYVRAGSKANVIADRATAVLDIRALPGMDRGFVNAHLSAAMGDAVGVEIQPVGDNPANISATDSPLWDAITDSVEAIDGHRRTTPTLMTVTTDGRFWRERGTVVYGVGLYDDTISFSEMLSLFHGDNERVSVESVLRTTSLYEHVLDRFQHRIAQAPVSI